MSSAVADLETGLQAMLQLKPPGVSGSKIQGLTTLCVANVQFESVLIQKLYTHFKNAPGTHKLGVLYVVDSVTRKWTEQAKSAGQPINSEAPDGTFADGVNRVKELLPAMMNIIIQSAPADQKDKIKKLVDIWEKGQTFPPHMLTQFKDQLNAPQAQSTTPPGSPPSHIQMNFGQPPAQPVPVPEQKNTSIADILAELARKNNAPPPVTSQPQDNSYMSNAQNPSVSQSIPAMNQNASFPPIPPPVNVPIAAPYATQPGLAAPNYASNQPNQYAGVPPPVVPAGGLDPAMQQVLLIKALADQGLSPEQITGIIAGLSTMGQAVPNHGGGLPQPVQYAPQNQNQNISNVPPNSWGPRPDDSRDRNGFHDREGARSPLGRYRQRSRSRSPQRGWNARGSPTSHRRNEPSFEYERERNSPGQNRGDGRGRGRGNEYRQRSPPRRGHSPSPPQSSGEKWIGHDSTIPRGSIKVLSRTLFVGGVTMPEIELRRIFDELGQVQTCITNKDKRHAFVKMVTRADAVRARDAMQKTQLRTRWGVGFGPREDCDYQTGVSVIPISKLTDADLKWFAKAEHGGSGGKPPESGMVVEEPDIEIGAGVSSKAISRRMQTDRSGNNGPKSSRERDEDEFGRARRPERDERQENHRHDRQNSTDNGPPSMPAVPPFSGGFGFMPNGMPVFPPNFAYNGQQPPPPGRR